MTDNIDTSQLWISGIEVRYGCQPSQRPPERVLEEGGKSENINEGLCGKYVWLVPQYTRREYQAATGFEVVIQCLPDMSKKNLSKRGGGKYRYLLPIMDTRQRRKIVHVVLLRQSQDLPCVPPGWDGATGNINEGRGNSFLYLLWKAESVQ
ncbi:hypothetical protein BD309DRAFT_970200 [Dichomitus squalens]|uniref:Uncharacterized protein n=1 Tax=Dichomitus squalens TaxID=114155 RepID=A0A4Q9PGY9_9APHY|nr:hypothetical protein BD309DRAFT_970200 [Dichomitus squalens]TBU52551.1 hypothetical protein BD310DRAFT_225740 [Dichomitus squalens]